MMNLVEKALEMRVTIERLAQLLNDNDAIDNIDLFPLWSNDYKTYEKNYKVRYDNRLFRVRKEHVTTPEIDPATDLDLYEQIIYQDGSPKEWRRPEDLNPYKMGDKVIFNDKIYESTIDNNKWSPEEYPLAWREVE